MTFSAVVVAAGSGSRSGGAKQWRALGGHPVIRWSVRALLDAGARQVIVAVAADAHDRAGEALDGLTGWRAVTGGATRSESVQAGLAALDGPADEPVLVHDAARPLLTEPVIRRVLDVVGQGNDAALPVLAVADSLRRGRNAVMGDAVPRDDLWRAQTPQGARRDALIAALDAWSGAAPPTDEAEALRAAGATVRLVEGDPRLMKLTYPEDFAMAEALIPRSLRVGSGFDVHRWGPGDRVWLCGLEIPHDQTLIGHSDADAGLHALTDAILGALADGDIGDHFPPTDPRWKGASSDRFLIHAAERVAARGGRITHVDVTLICERPKVKPHRQAMRERVAALLGLPLHAVSIKATTSEGLGFTGRGEGLAAQATATLELPD